MNKTIQVPLSEEDINTLKAGDYVYLSGIIYTARDAAHKRMYESMHKGESLPIELNGNVLYYLGPSPAREGQVIGSAGPTTSTRMDKYTPEMLDKGLKGMVGKGKRSPEVIEAMKRNGAVYFAAVGGAGALLSKCIKKAEVIAYDDLGTEAIRKLEIENLPVIVVIDKDGNNLSATAPDKWPTYSPPDFTFVSLFANIIKRCASVCNGIEYFHLFRHYGEVLKWLKRRPC